MNQFRQHHSTHTLAAKSLAAISLAFLIFSPCQSMGIKAAGNSSDLPPVCTKLISSTLDLDANKAADAISVAFVPSVAFAPAVSFVPAVPFGSALSASPAFLANSATSSGLNQTGTYFSQLQLVPPVQREDAEVVDSLYLSSKSPEQSRPFLIHNMAPGDGQSREYRLEIIHSQNAVIHFMLHIDEETKDLGDELTIHIAYGDRETILYHGDFRKINDLEFSIPVTVNQSGQSSIDWWIDADLPTSAGNEVQQAMLKATLNWRMVYADPSTPVNPVNPPNPVSPDPAGPSNSVPSSPSAPTTGGSNQSTPKVSPASSIIRAITSSPINTAIASFVTSWKGIFLFSLLLMVIAVIERLKKRTYEKE